MRHGFDVSEAPGPNFAMESKEENFKLAKLWSAQGLLCLKRGEPYQGLYARVFNNFKNATAAERSIKDQSQYLPGGYMMLHYNVKGIVTDRKCLPFSYPASAFEGDQALADLRRFEENSDGRREVIGDRYGKPKRKAVLCKSLPR